MVGFAPKAKCWGMHMRIVLRTPTAPGSDLAPRMQGIADYRAFEREGAGYTRARAFPKAREKFQGGAPSDWLPEISSALRLTARGASAQSRLH
jgi:hypothetical protein